ncbi:hypothetical protein V6N11_011213 [Hibiscus sabdariffa]|uniref:Uncharacterized protein n=1 Tax=Hibiscus sabdariffa TaxID=183260 RepID=A0ABR2S8E1_9ROSI
MVDVLTDLMMCFACESGSSGREWVINCLLQTLNVPGCINIISFSVWLSLPNAEPQQAHMRISYVFYVFFCLKRTRKLSDHGSCNLTQRFIPSVFSVLISMFFRHIVPKVNARSNTDKKRMDNINNGSLAWNSQLFCYGPVGKLKHACMHAFILDIL